MGTFGGQVVILLQAHVSVKRIEEFLLEDEGEWALLCPSSTDILAVPDWVSSLKRLPNASSSEPTRIGFEHATLRWNSGKQSTSDTKPEQKKNPSPSASVTSAGDTAVDSPDPVVFDLSNLTIDFPIGKLSVITGPTGAGKTAILIALLGEMELLEGNSWLPKAMTQVDPNTKLRNSIAYAAQTPWLQQRSIKDNILFGAEFDEARYEATLDACAL